MSLRFQQGTGSQGREGGVLFAGGASKGKWQSAYNAKASMQRWKPDEWHHIAVTYSASRNFIRFYLDGILVADSNERQYVAPADDSPSFSVGGDLAGLAAYYKFDEVRFSSSAASSQEIEGRAHRLDQVRSNEIWKPVTGLAIGDIIGFQFTPASGSEAGAPCKSADVTFTGIPLSNPQPPSTLLPPGATSVDFTADSATSTTCAYALGTASAYEVMTPLERDTAGTRHHGTIIGINPDPNTVNDVYIRCASNPDYLLHLTYRSLSRAKPPYPRKGNLWGWWFISPKGMPYAARIDLWLGASPGSDQIRELRTLNPNILVLTSMNAVENAIVPDESYYLKDVNGKRIEVWPGSYRLNLTKPSVAEYQARFAYQTVLDTHLMADGVFVDNVFLSQSYQTRDMYGNPVQIDADENGIADTAGELDAKWKAGVYHELRVMRELLPNAIISGHAFDISDPEISKIANGMSFGFRTADILEGERSFAPFWEEYHSWFMKAKPPHVTMIESSPLDQIAYGYGFDPLDKVPASTLEFARTYYPIVRFGLMLTLMNDGYFAHTYGDTSTGNDWWYDELDFNLGYPKEAAERVDVGFATGQNILENGDFEAAIAPPWSYWANAGEGCAGSFSRDTSTAASGSASAKLSVQATSGIDWQIALTQASRALKKGVAYDVFFSAKSDRARTITLYAQKGGPDWRGYGLSKEVSIDTQWHDYVVSFEANETVTDAAIRFQVGKTTGTVWLDNVRVLLHPPDVFKREFDNGLALLNGTTETQVVDIAPGYRRLLGEQAPMTEYITDNTNDTFRIPNGTWNEKTHDSGEWKATGPYFHNWGANLRELVNGPGEAQWILSVPAADTYTIAAWWPAAPAQATWSGAARYEIVAHNQVVSSVTLDQRARGDEWHGIGEAYLSPDDGAYVRLTCAGPCVADALHVRSAKRYNNGERVHRIMLQPFDGIMLRKEADSPPAMPSTLRIDTPRP